MENIKLDKIGFNDFQEIINTLSMSVEMMGVNYFGLHGKDIFVYEILFKILVKNDRVNYHHDTSKKYRFKCTRGEAWALLDIYQHLQLCKPMERLLMNLHKFTV